MFYYLLMLAATLFVLDILTTNFLPYGIVFILYQFLGFAGVFCSILFFLSLLGWLLSLKESKWQTRLIVFSAISFNLSFFLFLNQNPQPDRYISHMHFVFYISLIPLLIVNILFVRKLFDHIT